MEMEQVAVRVNEGRRRKEVVEEVLASAVKKTVNVSAVASVNLGKVKNLRGKTEKEKATLLVDDLEIQLKKLEVFAQQFAKDVVDWARLTTKVVGALRTWAVSFGKVIGLSIDQESEAFEAFLAVVEQQLMPLCVDLEAILNERLLKEIAHLLKTMSQPYKLLASMHEQEPLHYHYLTMPPASKGRQAHAAMQSASLNYVALRAQLLEDLPQYLSLLNKGMAISVRRFADIQTRFWKDVKDKWGELWEMLRVEGELNAGYEETIAVWSTRWMDVNEVLSSLNISQAKRVYQEPERARPPPLSGLPEPSRRGTADILSSLDPAPSYHGSYVSSPLPLASSSRSRHRNSEDSSRRPIRRSSNDSLHSTVRASKATSPARRSAGREDYYPDYFLHGDHPYNHPYSQDHPYSGGNRPESTTSMPAIPRRKSMPLSELNSSSARRATSPGDYEHHLDHAYPNSPPYTNHPYGTVIPTDEPFERSRPTSGSNGRVSRSTSKKRATPTDSSPPSIPSAPNGKPQRPAHNRNRSSSITSFFKGHKSTDGEPTIPQMPDPKQHLPPVYTDQWAIKPAKYVCQVIHPCNPPAEVSYFSFPFFDLQVGVFYEVLQEAGHPSIHPKLPLYVDEGEDCLLLCRDMQGKVGWALASFLEPVNIPVSR
ncbi:hypothetical protein NMY22_g6942 [Coprinellus aureogranulatus]|nr:hypothetical protein NMY22_g6942 [Coprinellus aureogranulatus]